ncbi:YceI family protein [Aquimarina sp. 2201CG5-10]|uniref:YceI family protein n=1 Tax=Aquimarina callyspongiae TaxID=3098150 RepID=UPI002AB33E92|nr:YceI family protein [Aquimarina sp. 2201CG5-10]MDY8138873.1 YceI family protein [Aquimarina sp. 2201CG5-10]
MKNYFALLFFLLTITAIGQEKYLTKKGTINFEASVPSFEEVKAKNSTVTAILNADKGEIAALALMKGFRFKNALMEEHFNENYVESDDHPKATFKGKLVGFDKNNVQSEYQIKGTLTLHGKSKDIDVKASVNKNGDTYSLSSSFTAKPEDFDISIPKIVSKKIAQDVVVSIDFDLIKK